MSLTGNAEIIEIIIRDFSGAKIESFKFNFDDTNQARRVFNLLNNKYGFHPFYRSKTDSDMKWLDKVE